MSLLWKQTTHVIQRWMHQANLNCLTSGSNFFYNQLLLMGLCYYSVRAIPIRPVNRSVHDLMIIQPSSTACSTSTKCQMTFIILWQQHNRYTWTNNNSTYYQNNTLDYIAHTENLTHLYWYGVRFGLKYSISHQDLYAAVSSTQNLFHII